MGFPLKLLLSKVIPAQLLQHGYRFIPTHAIKLDSLKLVYVPIPKVANHSIKKVLAQKVGMRGKLSAHKYDWNYVALNTLSAIPYYSFSMVRNPLDRLVSCYVQKLEMKQASTLFWKYGNQLKKGISFYEFANFVCKTPDSIADRHFKSQHCFLFYNNQLVVDYVGRFENLEEDWGKIAERFELESLSHVNKSIRLDLNKYYSKELAETVAVRYQKDIKLLGYESEVASFIAGLD